MNGKNIIILDNMGNVFLPSPSTYPHRSTAIIHKWEGDYPRVRQLGTHIYILFEVYPSIRDCLFIWVNLSLLPFP